MLRPLLTQYVAEKVREADAQRLRRARGAPFRGDALDRRNAVTFCDVHFALLLVRPKRDCAGPDHVRGAQGIHVAAKQHNQGRRHSLVVA